MGTYGLAAYSATKFGLRGLAEALQQELISDNIRISVIFAPAVDTPGLEEARKKMPEISKIMHGSDMMKAEEIGKITINGIKSGKFSIPCNLIGQMVAIATAGLSPQRSFLVASIEVVFSGFFRFLALLSQFKMYGIIEKWHPQKEQ
ncbi:hypothetical protein COLO4_00130 [Corchorus olitorius]|uniref:Short-chain dehydrogenase/reductase SDR n=1 Tax=Corchorus olitorius TaxID=93759 RepID=A0A1R3L4I5_9ROSI|nr:hypothetical protein COLO4_00130 [Corchorus olitorius]